MRSVRYRSATLLLVLIISTAVAFGQEARVVLRVEVPASTPRDAKIYVAGNQRSLGDWDPGRVELRKMNDSMWIGEFSFIRGIELEFKITRGTWNSQAIYEDGTIPGNNRLAVDKDTIVYVSPKAWSDHVFKSSGSIVGAVRYHRGLIGEGLNYARDLIVWLPPSYGKDTGKRYPVLYMHDGQNIIDPSTSFIGYDWKVDDVADSLIKAGKIEEIIVVGIYNSPDRMKEYSDTELGRNYARFVVQKVKPLIDSTYRTKPGRANTAVMGSSMGGLISFLFIRWYPDVFSKAGCLSSVFSFDNNKLLKEMKAEEKRPGDFKIYMDCGGYAGERTLKPGMDSMIALLKGKGYREHVDFEWFYDEHAEHSERAWAARIWRPLTFFFGK